MKRRTPPVAVQVIPLRSSKALLQARLIDFDTGSAELEQQHPDFLLNAINRARTNSAYHIQILGFASRLGEAAANEKLSLARMQSVVTFLKAHDGRVLNSLELFQPFGSSMSGGGASDDSPEYRAVEIHIFIGEIPPLDPPGHRKVDPPKRPTLPGGQRFRKWAVAAPGGGTVLIGPSFGPLTVGLTVGVNFFFVRNTMTGEVRRYGSLALGPGVSLGIPASATSLGGILQNLFTGLNFSNLSFTEVFPPHEVTFAEVESSLVSLTGGNVGAGNSFSAAHITFHSPGVQQFGKSGLPLPVEEDIWSFNSIGRNFQVGAGASGIGGPLIGF